MANKNLTGQTIAGSYQQLLIVNAEAGVTGQTTVATQIMCGTATAAGGEGTTLTTPLYVSRDRVGIGTATPVSAFEIEDGLTTGGAILTLGTKETTVVANDVLGRIDFYAPLEGSGTDAILPAASIAAVAQDTFANDNNSTALHFVTGKSESTASKTAAMVIDEDGYVGIGDSSPENILDIGGGSTGTTMLVRVQGLDLDANGEAAYFQASANRSGGGSARVAELGSFNNTSVASTCGLLSLQAHDGVYAFLWLDEDDDLQVSNSSAHIGTTSGQEIHDDITASDERLKDISSDAFPYGLDAINQLKPIKFRYKYKTKNDWKLGLGAQTTQPIVPETVIDTEINVEGLAENETKLRMSYSQFIPILIKSIQELSTKVDALENNNEQGESSNEQEQEEPDSGASAGESTGEDSGGDEGNNSDSSDTASGASETSDSSSDDGNESAGSSGSDASDDSEGGSGADDSEGSEGESSGDGE